MGHADGDSPIAHLSSPLVYISTQSSPARSLLTRPRPLRPYSPASESHPRPAMSLPALHNLVVSGLNAKPDNMTEDEYMDMMGRLQFGEKIPETLGPVLLG